VSFAGAASLVFFASIKNRIRRTLRQPRYLVFTIFGIAYLWTVVARRSFAPSHSQTTLASHASPVMLLVVAAFAVVYLVFVWVFGSDGTALSFTEPEIQFFFTAPVGRRTLIQYRLVRILVTTALGGPLLALITRRGEHFGFYAVGVWLALATLSLHRVCASLTRAMLAEHGFAGLRRRLVSLGAIAGAAGAVVYACVHAIGDFPPISLVDPSATLDALSSWARANESALSWILFPVAAPYRVCTAQSLAEFLSALPGAFAVLAVHYAWASTSSVAFEESEAEAAEKRSRRLAAARGGTSKTRRGRPLFDLAPRGPAWVAIFWKNLIAGNRTFSRPRLVILFVTCLVIPGVVVVATTQRSSDLLAAVGVLLGTFAVMGALLGPHMMRSDFRLDLPQIDILRSYPVLARDIVMGELFAPLAVLAVIEWIMVFAAFTLTLEIEHGEFLGLRIVALLAVVLALPAITLCGLVVRNGAVLVFPGWMASADKNERGIEVLGQRLFAMFATLVVLALALVPAGLVGGLVGVVLDYLVGPIGFAVGGVVGAGVVYLIAFLAMMPLARAFERFDVAQT
jgi:ABC-2 type transport system permease protein